MPEKDQKKPSAKKGSKTKHPATLRSTSGAGFEFEDLISAWLMIKMLLGEPLPGIAGQGHTLQAQVSSLGWRIDDLLVTGTDGDKNRRLAISAKGNVQVSRAGLPADFVERAWEQWREPNSPMKRQDDGLALVSRSGPVATFDPYWKEIKDASLAANPELGLARIRENMNQSRIFDCVRKAAGSANATDEETLALIRHLHVLPVDFQLAHSDREAEAIGLCRRVLVSGDLANAEELWTHLINIATDVRLRRGTITLTNLLAKLRGKFVLSDHPNFVADWQTLTNITVDLKARQQTELPSGYSIERPDVAEKLRTAILHNAVTVLFAESGAGKSSLAKIVLDRHFAGRRQVWFGPEELRTALSAVRRSSLPLRNDLVSVLQATTTAQNVLVLDSAERIEPVELPIIKGLLDELLQEATSETWRVIIMSQTQSWAEIAQALMGNRTAHLVELEAVSLADVRLAVSQTPSLAWLGAHDQTLAALRNLRTLAWVVQAGPALRGESGLASHTAVADTLWRHWTKDGLDVQALMMRLGEREASFERSFPLSEFDPGDLAILRHLPKELPLLLNHTSNRIEFEHDLAADWARYQFLKQHAQDTSKWAALAANPLWIGALHMFGQHLLRVPVGATTAWDRALEEAESIKLPLAADVLLDALTLDPEALNFLRVRTALLFKDHGQRLNKLIVRFHYLGTVPRRPPVELGEDGGMGIYLDARFRSIVYGRWPPIALFLIDHRHEIAPLLSTAVAELVGTWLSGTPLTFPDGSPLSFRREFAELALETVRAAQVKKALGMMFLTREPTLHQAALAGATDLPDEIGMWALEMAGRREPPDDVKAAISDGWRKRAEEEAARLKKDPAARETDRRRRHAAASMVYPRPRSLPPWPLGPSQDVDRDFRDACLKNQALGPLMRTRPEIAAEVLLALIIEEDPREEETASSRIDINLGLEHTHEGYPTAFWKSPFFPFLQAAPREALAAVIQLVNFCTERWAAEYRALRDVPAATVVLELAGKEEPAEFIGQGEVFNWTQENSSANGHLHSALDAVERWLTLRLDAGEDIEPDIDRLLGSCRSTAALGLLVNIGKYRPDLFKGPLACLLTHPALYRWDNRRVENIDTNFDLLTWGRAGEMAFEMAKSWVLAPHRQRRLLQIAVDLLTSDQIVARRLREAIKGWKIPNDRKLALEQRMLMAALDRINYHETADADNDRGSLTLVYPDELRADVASWEAEHSKPLQLIQITYQCEKALATFGSITDDSAEYLCGLIDTADEQIPADDISARAITALAATLANCAEEWLSVRPAIRDKVLAIVRDAVSTVGDDVDQIRRERVGIPNENLKFAAFAIMHQWLKGGDTAAKWEPMLLRLLTSGSNASASVIVAIAFARRDQLGTAWWRLNQAMLLWSALSMLAPSYDDPDGTSARWSHWLARLRRFPVRKGDGTWEALDFERIAIGLQRLEGSRWERAYAAGRGSSWRRPRPPNERTPSGLDTDLLAIGFSWLIRGAGSGDLAIDRELTMRLWRVEVDRQKKHGKEDDEYALPSQSLGYDLMRKLATLVLAVPSTEAPAIWEEVLRHGPQAHFTVRQFITGIFEQLQNDADPERFLAIWRAMAMYGLTAQWQRVPRHWFSGERMLGDLLGFGSEDALAKLGPGTVLGMSNVYERWAREHLGADEENLMRFAQFLEHKAGSLLRIEGLVWLAAALKGKREHRNWRRKSTTDSLIELLNVTLNEDWAALRSKAVARTAVIEIAAALAALTNPTALALQERIKRLR